MRLDNRIIGAAATFGGIAIIYGASGFRSVPGQQFGSAFFPTILGGALIATGALIAMSASQIVDAALAPLPDQRPSRALAVIAATLLWIICVESLGFILTTGAIIGGLAMALGARWISAGIATLLAPLLMHLIFGVLLRVPLPRGIVEAWLP